jgi:hypothetical protein
MSSFNIFSPVLCITYEDDCSDTKLHSCGIAYSEAEALLLVKEQAIKYFNNDDGYGDQIDTIRSTLASATTSEQIHKELMVLGAYGQVCFFFELNAQTLPCSYVCSIAYNDKDNHSQLHSSFVATNPFDYIKNFIATQVATQDKADVQECQDEEALLQVVHKLDCRDGIWFKWDIIATPWGPKQPCRGQKHKLDQDEAQQVQKKNNVSVNSVIDLTHE